VYDLISSPGTTVIGVSANKGFSRLTNLYFRYYV
jgi:hypothetical protein